MSEVEEYTTWTQTLSEEATRQVIQDLTPTLQSNLSWRLIRPRWRLGETGAFGMGHIQFKPLKLKLYFVQNQNTFSN